MAVITYTVIVMKRLILLAVLGTTILAQQPAARAVYILPMTGGLDQYLANQITHDHVMQVVRGSFDGGCRFHRPARLNL